MLASNPIPGKGTGSLTTVDLDQWVQVGALEGLVITQVVGWECDSVEGPLPRMGKALDLVPSNRKTNNNNKKTPTPQIIRLYLSSVSNSAVCIKVRLVNLYFFSSFILF